MAVDLTVGRPGRRRRRGAPARPAEPRGWRAFWRSLCGSGLLLGALFFAASLTPSLIPRSFLLQGALAGACFAIGYGLGVCCRWLWDYLELPWPGRGCAASATWSPPAVAGGGGRRASLWRATGWQNSIRERMDMPPVETIQIRSRWLLVAAVVCAVLILLARLFRAVLQAGGSAIAGATCRSGWRQVIGIAVAVVLFVLVFNDVLLRGRSARSPTIRSGRSTR